MILYMILQYMRGGNKVPDVKKLIEKMKQQPNGIKPEEAGRSRKSFRRIRICSGKAERKPQALSE